MDMCKNMTQTQVHYPKFHFTNMTKILEAPWFNAIWITSHPIIKQSPNDSYWYLTIQESNSINSARHLESLPRWQYHIIVTSHRCQAMLEISTGPPVQRQQFCRTGNFLLIFFNFMFMIWDSRHEDLQLFWLSFKHWCHGISNHWWFVCSFNSLEKLTTKKSPLALYKASPCYYIIILGFLVDRQDQTQKFKSHA